MATGDSLVLWGPLNNEAPAANMATLDWRNGHPVLDFDAAATEAAFFTGIMPSNYSGLGINVRIIWAASTATSGAAVLDSAFERMNTDLDADSFATAVQATTAATNATSGITTTTVIAHTNAQLDGTVAGEAFRLRVERLGANASDTMAGDLEIFAVEIREA